MEPTEQPNPATPEAPQPAPAQPSSPAPAAATQPASVAPAVVADAPTAPIDVDLEHPAVKAAIERARVEAVEAETARRAEVERQAALTEEQRLREKATADESARKTAEERATKFERERDMIASLASMGRSIAPGDPRMGVASSLVGEMMAADPKLTVREATAKALAQHDWLGDAMPGSAQTARPSTVAPQAPAPTHVPAPPKPKDAFEMSKDEFNARLRELGVPRIH
jgi:hypothetical protein